MKRANKNVLRYTSLAMGAVLLAAGILSGCGASGSKGMYDTAATAEAPAMSLKGDSYYGDDIYYANDSVEWEMDEGAAEEAAAAGAESPAVKDSSRKLIRNVNLDVETETFDELLATVTRKTAAFGGYIEDSYTYNGSAYYGRKTRNANMTIRIPSQNFDEFLSTVAEVSNVISRNESVSDVTLQYVDMDSHKKALQAEYDRLLELMEQVETIEDIIALENRLSDVRYQIESMESQLRTLDNQVSYSTLYLQVQEVEKLTPVKEQTIWEKIATGFANSLYGVGSGLLDFFVGVIIDLPYLVVWGIIIFLIVLIIKKIVKRRRNRKPSKEERKEAKKAKKQKKAAGEEAADQNTDTAANRENGSGENSGQE